MPLYGCYLLRSLREDPAARGKTYIGFTVNPQRRLRQHNGEISAGAYKTRKLRPVEMLLVVHGFRSKREALQFEWAWQHPTQARLAREATQGLKKKDMGAAKGKVRILLEMLWLSQWQTHPLFLQFTSPAAAALREAGGCPVAPPNVTVSVAPLSELPLHSVCEDDEDDEDENESSLSQTFRLCSEGDEVSKPFGRSHVEHEHAGDVSRRGDTASGGAVERMRADTRGGEAHDVDRRELQHEAQLEPQGGGEKGAVEDEEWRRARVKWLNFSTEISDSSQDEGSCASHHSEVSQACTPATVPMCSPGQAQGYCSQHILSTAGDPQMDVSGENDSAVPVLDLVDLTTPPPVSTLATTQGAAAARDMAFIDLTLS